MGTKPSVVQINGKRYNVITGQLIGASGPVIDGFRRPKPLSPIINQTVGKFKPVAPHLTAAKEQLSKPAHGLHKRTQRTKTLMRGIVVKPSAKRQPKARGSEQPATAAGASKISRAARIAKNHAVKRFGNPQVSAYGKAAAQAPRRHTALKQNAPSAAVVQATPSTIANLSHQQLERLLDEALIKADAHKQSRKRNAGRGVLGRVKLMPTWAFVACAALVLVLAGGLFAWRNLPSASMKFASMKSHVDGTVPAYVPTGFKFAGPISYANGTLSMTYKDSADGTSYVITQQSSDLNSAALAASSGSANGQLQTSQVKGATVFYDGNNNAQWVSGGVQYKILNKAKLSTDDLGKIAGSLSNQ